MASNDIIQRFDSKILQDRTRDWIGEGNFLKWGNLQVSIFVDCVLANYNLKRLVGLGNRSSVLFIHPTGINQLDIQILSLEIVHLNQSGPIHFHLHAINCFIESDTGVSLKGPNDGWITPLSLES